MEESLQHSTPRSSIDTGISSPAITSEIHDPTSNKQRQSTGKNRSTKPALPTGGIHDSASKQQQALAGSNRSQLRSPKIPKLTKQQLLQLAGKIQTGLKRQMAEENAAHNPENTPKRIRTRDKSARNIPAANEIPWNGPIFPGRLQNCYFELGEDEMQTTRCSII